MKKFVPYEKMSKKQKREIDKEKRNLWNMNPATRKSENKISPAVCMGMMLISVFSDALRSRMVVP